MLVVAEDVSIDHSNTKDKYDCAIWRSLCTEIATDNSDIYPHWMFVNFDDDGLINLYKDAWFLELSVYFLLQSPQVDDLKEFKVYKLSTIII